MIDEIRCSRQAEKLRARFGKSNLEPVDPFALAAMVPRLTIVLYPLGNSLSGLCVRDDRYSLIAVNSRHTLGRQNFTLAHEMHHLFFDTDMRSIICPAGETKDPLEQTADFFASRFLLPEAALDSWLRTLVPEAFSGNMLAAPSFVNLDDAAVLHILLETERRFGISRRASLVRFVEAGALEAERSDQFKDQVKRNARKNGYPLALYEPRRGSDMKRVSGDYIELIGLLLGESKISEALAAQLLSDGFRSDIAIIDLKDDDCEA